MMTIHFYERLTGALYYEGDFSLSMRLSAFKAFCDHNDLEAHIVSVRP